MATDGKKTKKARSKGNRTFSKGDRVEWSSHGGTTREKGKAVGTVIRTITRTMSIKGHKVKASKDEPQYLVESDNGGRAAHKPSALRRSRTKAKDASKGSNGKAKRSTKKKDATKAKRSKEKR